MNPVTGKRVRSGVSRIAGVALVAMSMALAGCTRDEWARGAMPKPITTDGARTLHLWQGSWIAALIVGVIVWGLIVWCVIAYRRKKGDGLPKQTRYNIPIEIFYTVAPAIMIGVLFAFTLRDQTVLTKDTGTATNHVTVVGYQWQWSFQYSDDKAFDVGTTASPPTLWLPVNKRVQFTLLSPDVIHSFWVPDFLFHMDVVPGRVNKFELTPNTIGSFKGRCAELCGAQHARMIFNVKVVSQADYDKHIAYLRSPEVGQSGQVTTDRYHLSGRTLEEVTK